MRTKKITILIAMFSLVLFPLNTGAVQVARQEAELNTPGVSKILYLPEQAGNSPVIYLGETFDVDSGLMVEGYAIIHRKNNKAKPEGKGKPKTPKESSCYSFISKGAKWKTVEDWVVNPTNNNSISADYVLSNLSFDIEKWENAANKNILGNGQITYSTLVADETSTDGLNEVYFGSLDSGTIGVTIVWGVFSGSPRNRVLVEWDQVYNTYYNWSNTGASGKMDFESIATHELGHSLGMGDMYESSCQEATMFGYASEGETNKRSLEPADMTGISKLYR